MKKILLFSVITSICAALATYYKVPESSSEADVQVMQQPAQKTLSPDSAHATDKSQTSDTAGDSAGNNEKLDIKVTKDKEAFETNLSFVNTGERKKNSLSSYHGDDVSPPVSKIIPSSSAENSEVKVSIQKSIGAKVPGKQFEQEPILETAVAASQNLDARSIAKLKELVDSDSRAAFDLGLRYFRGDGIEQNSYQAIEWMRKAGEKGNLNAQAALGRIYLTGLEEMGPDFQEAHKWLLIAASRGDEESGRLLTQAGDGRDDERTYQRLKKDWYMQTYRCWYSKYAYTLYWYDGRWLVY